jgi:hypothetical protein
MTVQDACESCVHICPVLLLQFCINILYFSFPPFHNTSVLSNPHFTYFIFLFNFTVVLTPVIQAVTTPPPSALCCVRLHPNSLHPLGHWSGRASASSDPLLYLNLIFMYGSFIVLMMEAVSSSETTVYFYKGTRRKILKDSHLHLRNAGLFPHFACPHPITLNC